MWKILQYKKPEDFVICTGKQYTIKQFINMVAKKAKKLNLDGKEKGLKKRELMKIIMLLLNVKKYLRPAEVDTLKGNYSKAKKLLNWKPKHNIQSLINEMIKYEYNLKV